MYNIPSALCEQQKEAALLSCLQQLGLQRLPETMAMHCQDTHLVDWTNAGHTRLNSQTAVMFRQKIAAHRLPG